MKKTLTVYLVIVVVAAVSSFGENASAGEWATIFNGKRHRRLGKERRRSSI